MKLNEVVKKERKIMVTFSLDKDIHIQFSELAKKLNINKSLFVEKSIIKFMEELNK